MALTDEGNLSKSVDRTCDVAASTPAAPLPARLWHGTAFLFASDGSRAAALTLTK